jgi:glycerophosphoryl diester phosphodiesterase
LPVGGIFCQRSFNVSGREFESPPEIYLELMSNNPRGADRPFFRAATNVPEVIAHRGGGGEWPGETIYAFEQSIRIGVDVLEMDVHRTRDGHLVLMHNPEVDDTTDGTGRIKDMTLAQIKELNIEFNWPPGQQPDKPVKVPTLREVFEAFPDRRMNIEIKQKEPSLVKEFCDLLREHGMTDRVLVASFWNGVLHDFRQACPEVANSASTLEVGTFFALDGILHTHYKPDSDALQVRSELAHVHTITRKIVDKAHSLNLKIHAWTVNDKDEMRRLASTGIDGIITDYPSRLLEVLGRL